VQNLEQICYKPNFTSVNTEFQEECTVENPHFYHSQKKLYSTKIEDEAYSE